MPMVGRRRSKKKRGEQPAGAAGAVPALVDTGVLTPEQHAALFGPERVDGTIPATVMAGAAGVGVLALRHIARRMVGEPDTVLTVQDRLAMAMAPKLTAEMKRNVSRRVEDSGALPGRDPIEDLLGTSEAGGTALVTDTEKVRLET